MARRTFNATPHPMLKGKPFSERWKLANTGYNPLNAAPSSPKAVAVSRGYAKLHGKSAPTA